MLKPQSDPAGPQPFPIIGNLPYLWHKDGSGAAIERLIQRYGDFVRLKMPHGAIFFCANADLVQEVLGRQDDFQRTIPERSPLHYLRQHSFGDGLLTAADSEPAWQIARRVLTPAFSSGAFKYYHPRLQEVVDELLAHLSGLSDGTPFLATSLMKQSTIEAICYAGFDKRFGVIGTNKVPAFAQAIQDILDDANRSIARLLPPAFYPLAQRRLRQADAILRSTVFDIAERRKLALSSGEAVPGDILQMMLTTRDRVTGETLPDENIFCQLTTFLLAGSDTLSSLLCYALYFVSKNPAIEAQLLEEVDRVLGRDFSYKPSFEDLKKFEYIPRVLKEALRIRAPAQRFSRTAMKDTTLGQRFSIPNGSPIFFFLPGLHHHKRYWGEDPSRFDPDRFLPANAAARHPNAYHPFGMGAHYCLGARFAMIEATLVLARFYQRFRARTADPAYQLKDVVTLTSCPVDLYMRLERRSEVRGAMPIATMQRDAVSPKDEDCTTALWVLYGSNMGTSQDLAEDLARQAAERNFTPTVCNLDDCTGALPTDVPVVIVTATYNGAPPDNAACFVDWLFDIEQPIDSLKGVRFAVLGCGNKKWHKTYQKFPRSVAERLAELGASSMYPIGACDADGDFESDARIWTAGLLDKLVLDKQMRPHEMKV